MKKCGDCIHADACEHNQNIPLFNSANEAYCKGFKDRTKYVEVVRCKDCKHSHDHEINRNYRCHRHARDGYSQVFDATFTDNDFCSYGERRTDNG